MPSSVVGTCTTATPRWYTAAAKPATSVTMPPPTPMTTSARVRPIAANPRVSDSMVASDFASSLSPITNTSEGEPRLDHRQAGLRHDGGPAGARGQHVGQELGHAGADDAPRTSGRRAVRARGAPGPQAPIVARTAATTRSTGWPSTSTTSSATSAYSGRRSSSKRRRLPSGSSPRRGRWSAVTARTASSFGVGAQPHDPGVGVLQRPAVGLGQHHTARGGDHRRGRRGEGFHQRVGLERAIGGLTVGLEDLPDRATGAGLDHRVAVEERPMQARRDRLADRGLAGRHHADEHQVRRARRVLRAGHGSSRRCA